MRVFREWIRRLQGTLFQGRHDAELEHEIRSHMEMAAEDARRRGLDRADAWRAARIEAGGASQAMDALRDQRGLPWLDDLARDVSHGLRTLRRTPVFTAVALLTLALGIGANTAIFSIVNSVILRPLDYPKPEQLMYLTTEFPALGLTRNPLSVQEYLEFRQMNQSFAAVGAYRTMGGAYTTGEVNLTAGGSPLRVRSISVDAHLLNTLGVQPAHGRFFREEETNRAGGVAPPLAILSHELWQTVFGGQPLVGQTLNVDGRSHEILGIMPSGIDVMDNRTAIWLPLERLVREVDPAVPIVRLRDMESVFAESIRRPRLLAQLLGAFAGLALLLAAVGTYGVLSYMTTERRREIGIRMALGGARSGVVALVMKEGLQLTTVGVVVGLAGALGLNRLIASVLFGVQPTDPTTLAAVIMTITLVAAAACWLPAWRASRLDPSVVLRTD